MDYDLCHALELNAFSQSKTVTIEEHGFIDASFCIGSILQETAVNKKRKIAFVLHHHGFGHYQGIGIKLGYNLQGLKESKLVHIVNVMAKFGLCYGKENSVKDILIDSYNEIIELIQNSPNDLLTIVLEHPENIGLASGEYAAVLNYVRIFQNIPKQWPGVNLILITQSNSSLRPLVVLQQVLQRQSDLTISVRGLRTGSAPDISGSITVKRREFVNNSTQKLSEFHYQLLEKKIRLFAPGTVQIR